MEVKKKDLFRHRHRLFDSIHCFPNLQYNREMIIFEHYKSAFELIICVVLEKKINLIVVYILRLNAPEEENLHLNYKIKIGFHGTPVPSVCEMRTNRDEVKVFYFFPFFVFRVDFADLCTVEFTAAVMACLFPFFSYSWPFFPSIKHFLVSCVPHRDGQFFY